MRTEISCTINKDENRRDKSVSSKVRIAMPEPSGRTREIHICPIFDMQSNRKHRGLVKIRSVKDTGSRTATYLKRAHKSKKRNKGCKNMRKKVYLFEKVRIRIRKKAAYDISDEADPYTFCGRYSAFRPA